MSFVNNKKNGQLVKLSVLFGVPANYNLWGEEDARPLHLLRSNLIMDRRVRRGDPAGAQTQNLQNRNLTLYSIELRGRERSTDRTGETPSA